MCIRDRTVTSIDRDADNGYVTINGGIEAGGVELTLDHDVYRLSLIHIYKDGTQTVRFEDALTADCGEKRLRLRSNASPSGAFEQQNGLAQARWRGRAPTSSDLSSSAGPKAPQTNLFVCGAFLFAHSVVRK